MLVADVPSLEEFIEESAVAKIEVEMYYKAMDKKRS